MRTFIWLLVLVLASPVWAVKTSHWVHTTEADFKEGTFTNVVATNLGDLKLSRQVKMLLGQAQDPRISAVFSLAQMPDGTIYAGTGPEGVLLSIRDDKVTTATVLGEHVSIFSLLADSKGRLLIGTGGEKGEILRMDRAGEKPKHLFADDDAQYIWAMVEAADGTVYAATGPNGKLYQINSDGTNKVLLDSDENNLLCMISDGKDSLYVGTDPHGLVYRINRHTGELFVLYNATEGEVGSLIRDVKGNLYAATSEADGANAPVSEGADDKVGRPEADTRGIPFPSQPPSTPKPPEIPSPAPGEPLPIPRTTTAPMSMMILADGDESKASPTTEETKSGPGQHKPARSPSPGQKPRSNGNAIYRIDPEGFVTEVFRQPVSVFAMVEQNGTLLVATGDEGEVFQVRPDAEETLVLAKVDPKDVLCLLPTKDGRIFMGTANSGDVATMSQGYALEGTFTSPVLDAKQISRFGKIHLRGTLPTGTGIKISTRSGNVEEASAPGWSKWSDGVPATEYVQIPTVSARFFQYRLTFSSTSGAATPIVNEIDVAYQMPNLAPQIKAIKIPESEESSIHQGTGKLTITWDASDPNEDELEYSLYFRNGSTSPWILMKDKLKDATYDWDTRGVADGLYQVKVEASDAASNPPGQGKTASRVSDPFVIDNTPPVIGDIKTTVTGADVTIKLAVVDRTSTVAKLEYSIDSSENWQMTLPSDNIADSPEEAYQFVVSGLSVGAHQIRLRATDSKGNRSYESVNVAVEKPAAK